jgi:ABC-type branched-subunit amino acid transport system substrate-binding protein
MQRLAKAILFSGLSSSFVLTLAAGSLTPGEQKGKQIYFQGTSPGGGLIQAYIGHNRIPLPGTAATCASCHGPDGRGRPEAGVIPSDITWSHLVKSYGHTHPMGRGHQAFDEESVKASLLTGRDPSGNPLNSSMPVYSMSKEDLSDLVAYLKRLEEDLDPGLTATEIRIGTVQPTSGRMAAIGRGIQDLLEAYFEEINSTGGIYNRKLRLVKSSYDSNKHSPLSGVTRLVDEEDIFALVSPVVAGADQEIGELAEREGVPVIGPLTLFSPDPYTLNDFTFYVYSGLREQAEALLEFASQELQLEDLNLTVLGPDEERYRNIREAIADQSDALGWVSSRSVLSADSQTSSLVKKLQEEGTNALLFLGPADIYLLLQEADRKNWRPFVFLPSGFVRKDILELPSGFQKKVYISYPTIPSDQTRAGVAELQSLLKEHGLSAGHGASQVSALAAAKILVEGLKGAGRNLSRETFLRTLEKLNQFHTGLTPRITFGSNRRVGARGAYVVAVDLEARDLVPVGGWITRE